MRRITLLLLILLALGATGLADEGMWPPEQLPEIAAQLKALGIEIDPADLSSVTEYPLNAVISLGGCTASFVSADGLIVTNHHCAYGSIQYNSTPENNLLENGFLAADLKAELPAAPGSRVYVTVAFEDVTDRVLRELDGLSGIERYERIESREKELVAECEAAPSHRCRVSSYYGGLRYSLIKQFEIKDVRLVHAPASGIGKFGGDIDNWMWPRHTGDYSFYRAYVSPEGKSVAYDEANVPYRPKSFLKVSAEGVKEGDLVMVAGYPGSTSRYRLATEVEDMFKAYYPRRIANYSEWLEIIGAETKSRPEAAIKYAGLDASLNNGLKNNQGMLDGFAKSDMVERKKQLESDLAAWIGKDSDRQKKYGDAIRDLNTLLEKLQKTSERDTAFSMATGSSLMRAAASLYRLAQEKKKPDMERASGYQDRDLERIKQSLERLERTFDPAVDKAVVKHFTLKYNQLPEPSRVGAFDEWFGLKPGMSDPENAISKTLDEMYSKTQLGDLKQRLALMDASAEDLDASIDPFVKMAAHLSATRLRFEKEAHAATGELQALRPLYMQALIDFLKTRGQHVYPDANSSLRVTYGTLKGYSPRDAVQHTPFTRIEGILEKETGEDPFNTPPATLKAMREKRFGRWADSSIGSVPVNFLSTCDTTGGNSGSPTLNGRGELVGLLFDGNYESMISDWDFLPEVTRSIHVDMRYVLWLMDEVDGAHRLLKEMGIE